MKDKVFSDILVSIKQDQTPLNTLYFSHFNLNLLQNAIRGQFKKQTGRSIDRQNDADLLAIMRQVFIMNMGTPNEAVCRQVRQMNEIVINTALGQIHTGVSQYLDYSRDITMPLQPLDKPINTSTYGNKFGANNQIGI